MSNALTRFRILHFDVSNLFAIHPLLTQGIQGRNRQLTKPLLKSSLVLLCASFESYIEDVCRSGADAISERLDDPARLPIGIQQRIANKLKEEKHELAAWGLAGEGWRQLIRTQVDQLCDGMAGGMNTPNSRNVIALMKTVFGIKDVSQAWAWQGMSSAQAKAKLDNLVRDRGTIAHGRDLSINVQTCQSYNSHILSLVESIDSQADAAVRAFSKEKKS